MDARGAVETAATFRALMEEERCHVAAVASASTALTGHVPDTETFVWETFVWRLPPEIAASWEELAGRTDLTPYRALSLAVLNEERAFAFYSYVVSAATDPAVRRQAQALALEELNHAAKLRHQRRKAWRKSRREHGDAVAQVEGLHDLASLAAGMAAEATAVLRAAASALGSDDSSIMTRIADDLAALSTGRDIPGARIDPTLGHGQILRSALLPLEKMAEAFSDIAERTRDEAVMLEAQRLLGIAVGHAVALAERSR